jgi:hypothetical protein
VTTESGGQEVVGCSLVFVGTASIAATSGIGSGLGSRVDTSISISPRHIEVTVARVAS